MISHEQIIESYNQTNAFGKELSMTFQILRPGKVEIFMPINAIHLATAKVAHGGAIAGMMDAALGVAGLSLASQNGKVVSTVEFKMNFLTPVFLGDQLIAKGEVINAGKRIYYIEAAIINQNNALVAKGTGTFNAYPVEKILIGNAIP